MKRFNNAKGGTDAEGATCPFCGSGDTTVEQWKGSAICRKMFHCRACDQPFEQLT